MQSRIDAANYITTTIFDPRGQVSATLDALGFLSTLTYDPVGRTKAHENALGYFTTQNYDSVGNLIGQQNARGYFNTSVYDARNQRIATIDPLGFFATASYDGRGLNTGSQNQLGYYTTSVYDQRGSMIAHQDALGYITTTQFDALRRPEWTKDALGFTTQQNYDPVGHVSATIDALGYYTTHMFDQVGNRIGEQNARGFMTTYSFNAVNLNQSVQDPLGHFSTTIYDVRHMPVGYMDQLGHITTTVFEARGLPLYNIDADGNYTTTLSDPLSRHWYVIDADANITTTVYDPIGQSIGQIDAKNARTTSVYDGVGNQIAAISPMGAFNTSIYEPRNLPWQAQTPDGHFVTNTFDAARRLLYRVDGNAQILTLGYDARNEEITRWSGDGHRVTTTYDPLGQVVGVSEYTGLYTNAYDGRGHQTLEATPGQPGGTPFTYGFDPNGNRTLVGTAQGVEAQSFDARDMMIAKTDAGYAAGGIAAGTTNFGYDARRNLASQTNANGTQSTLTYDALGNNIQVYHANESGGMIAYVNHAFDALWRPTSRQTNTGSSNYFYDAVSQLINEVSSFTGSTTWVYDLAYRRTSQQTPTTLTSYTVNAADQITVMTVEGVPTTLGYDANGNTLFVATPAGTTTYAWDPYNRLASAALPSGEQLTMTYRADDMRFQKQSPSGSDVLLWSGSDVFNSQPVSGSGGSVTPTPPPSPVAGGNVEFVKYDTTTQGSWDPGTGMVYGTSGYNVIGDTSSIPSWLTMSEVANGTNNWATPTTDVRGLQKASSPTTRLAQCWYGSEFQLNLDINDGNSHQIAIYCLDWDTTTRTQRIDILDGATGAVLDTRTISSYHNGTWVVYDMTGSLQIRMTVTGGTNAVMSGIFFDPGSTITTAPQLSALTLSPSSLVGGLVSQGQLRFNVPATSGIGSVSLTSSDASVTVPSSVTPVVGSTGTWFPIYTSTESTSKVVTLTADLGSATLKTNLTQLPSTALTSSAEFIGHDYLTAGSWVGTYGGDGYEVIGDATSLPSYASLSVTGNTAYTWNSSDPYDARATVIHNNAAARQASCWYSTTNYTITLTLTGGTHRIGLYCLDWTSAGLVQRIDISDSTTGDIIDSQTVSGFQSGVWLFWNLSGTVKIKFTVISGADTVVSAITFDPVPVAPAGPPTRAIGQGVSLGRLLGSNPDGTPINLQYHTDATGNVIALTDSSGNVNTAYYTDAWGNVVTGSSTQNPYVNNGGLGYWQDADLNLNYVRARWLNPATGTWLSRDPVSSEPGYSYAGNRPTTHTDSSGTVIEYSPAQLKGKFDSFSGAVGYFQKKLEYLQASGRALIYSRLVPGLIDNDFTRRLAALPRNAGIGQQFGAMYEGLTDWISETEPMRAVGQLPADTGIADQMDAFTKGLIDEPEPLFRSLVDWTARNDSRALDHMHVPPCLRVASRMLWDAVTMTGGIVKPPTPEDLIEFDGGFLFGTYSFAAHFFLDTPAFVVKLMLTLLSPIESVKDLCKGIGALVSNFSPASAVGSIKEMSAYDKGKFAANAALGVVALYFGGSALVKAAPAAWAAVKSAAKALPETIESLRSVGIALKPKNITPGDLFKGIRLTSGEEDASAGLRFSKQNGPNKPADWTPNTGSWLLNKARAKLVNEYYAEWGEPLYKPLGPNDRGGTFPDGQIVINSLDPPAVQTETFFHELVHFKLTAKVKNITGTMLEINKWRNKKALGMYKNPQRYPLAQYTEEYLAEYIGTADKAQAQALARDYLNDAGVPLSAMVKQRNKVIAASAATVVAGTMIGNKVVWPVAANAVHNLARKLHKHTP